MDTLMTIAGWVALSIPILWVILKAIAVKTETTKDDAFVAMVEDKGWIAKIISFLNVFSKKKTKK